MFIANWTDEEIESLIEKREKGNNDYYYKYGRNKSGFWNKIANEINQEKKSFFTGEQCRVKFSNLVKDYNVSIINIIIYILYKIYIKYIIKYILIICII